jgi:hypothetical protein
MRWTGADGGWVPVDEPDPVADPGTPGTQEDDALKQLEEDAKKDNQE